MWPRPMLAQVVPVGARGDGTHPHSLFELQPAHELPEIDLSVSLRSRFLSERRYACVSSITRQGRLIFAMFVVGVSLVTAVFYLRNTIARQVLAVVALSLMLPSTLAGIGVLRYEMVCLLLRTYDTWFSLCCNFVCFLTLGFMFGDARAAVAFVVWASMHINILVDANIRAVKRMTLMNLAAAASMISALVAIRFGFTTGLQPIVLLRQGVRELSAEDVMASSGATSIALIVRNVVRYTQSTLLSSKQQVVCVSYRCTLRVVNVESNQPLTPSATLRRAAPATFVASPVQRLQYIPEVHNFDVRDTLAAPSRTCPFPARVVGVASLVATAAAGGITLSKTHQAASALSTLSSMLQLSSVVGTCAFCIVCARSLHRRLLLLLVSSFQFAFLSSQQTFVHVAVCDYFLWSSSVCLASLSSWLWIHWFLCVDALSPVAKDRLRVHPRFPAVVLSTWFIGWLLLLYYIVFQDSSGTLYDRVLFREAVLGHVVQVRVMPLFFNSILSLAACLMYLLHRAWTLDSDCLLLIDGRVAYQNYFSRPRQPGIRLPRIPSQVWATRKLPKKIDEREALAGPDGVFVKEVLPRP